LLFGLVLGTSADTYAAVAANAGCKEAVGCAGYYRAFAATTSPPGSTFLPPPSTVTGVALAAVGVQAATNGVQGVAKVDVAGFKFKTPADVSDGTTRDKRGLSFYFGYLGASGVWDNNTQTGAVVGAAAEVSSSITTIVAFYDRDNVEGFQWDLVDTTKRYDIFQCNGTVKTYDCIDPAGAIDVRDLVWTPLTRDEVACSTVVTGDYAANCTINTLSTQGELQSVPGTAVLSITARTVSQPMKINGVEHTPDKAKWDVRINYPWANKTALQNASAAKIALIALHAGKAGAAGVGVKDSGSGKAVTFQAAGGKAAYFGYIPRATIGGVDTPITTLTVTGEQLGAFSCGLLQPCFNTLTSGLANGLAALAAALKFFGWQSQMTIHAFSKENPGEIVWDPEVGVQTTAEESGAEMVVPGVLVALVAVLFC